MPRYLLATTALAGTVALGAVAAVPLAAQSPSPDAGASPARTEWGVPDFTGVWTTDDMRGVPRERPDEFGTRRFLTDEEFAQRLEQDAETRNTQLNRAGAFRNDFGTRTFRLTSRIIDPPDGKIPALTPAGEARRAARVTGSFGEGPIHGPEDLTLYDRCITRGVVGSMGPAIYGNGVYIVQSPGYMAITYEMVHDTRIIPIDGRPHIGATVQQYMGDARGHWDGDTLVVETANFTDKTAIYGTRHSAALRLVERFRRLDAETLEYQATVTDAETYTAPWTVTLMLTSPEGFRTFPYECHEGNRGMHNILSAERAEDAAIAEDLRQGIVRARKPVQSVADDDENE